MWLQVMNRRETTVGSQLHHVVKPVEIAHLGLIIDSLKNYTSVIKTFICCRL